MKLFLVLLIFVFCLAFPVQAPEAQDQNAGSEDSDENLTTLAARRDAGRWGKRMPARAAGRNRSRDAQNRIRSVAFLVLRMIAPIDWGSRRHPMRRPTATRPAARVIAIAMVAIGAILVVGSFFADDLNLTRGGEGLGWVQLIGGKRPRDSGLT